MTEFPRLLDAVQRNCDISDACHAGEYGLCTFLLKMREYYRWEHELPFAQELSKDRIGDWLSQREQQWQALEAEPYGRLPLGDGALDPFAADAANALLLPQGYVYSAGYGRFHKPVFFLGRLSRIERREGLDVVISSCEYARELSAPPAMLQGNTIFVREESVRRYVWEKIEEWRWRQKAGAMPLALDAHALVADPEAALSRLTARVMDIMILHELGEARAGALLGEGWSGLLADVARSRNEAVVRAVRDLLADCLSTLPGLMAMDDPAGLHFYFATFDGLRRELFPQALAAYARFTAEGDVTALHDAAGAGARHWLAAGRRMLAAEPAGREAAIAAVMARPL